MGLPNNLGRLSPAITSDASLNIGIGVTPSGSFKFEVGTTSKFTGVATFGSTLSNGTYSYTLPSATGTFALVGGAGVGTVTSVAAITLGTSGTDLSSTVANSTTTPVITLNVPTASASNRGALSAADWTTFNNKTSNTGTVTSVATAGTVSGLTLTGGTITTSGTITLGGTLSLTAANVNAVGAITNSTSGNAATATALSSGQSNWSGTGVLGNVVGLLAWKNYGNSHVIFDASQGTSPSGTSVSQSNVQNVWAASYPTLMGWNGSGTYGVRVDSARVADSSGSATYATNSTRLYATDNPYCYGCASPYYMYMTYDGTRWFLQVSPATPAAVRVSYADVAGSANSVSGGNVSGNISGNAGSVTYLPNRGDVAAYQVLWGAPYTNGIGTIAYSCAAITIQSSTGTLTATTFSGALSGNATTATAAQNATFLTQPNATWGGRVQLGGNGGGGAATVAVVQATNGNLHMDGGSGNAMYLNYYNNGAIYLNGGTYFISSNGSQYNGNAATATNSSQLNGYAFTSYAYRLSGTGYYQINDWMSVNGNYGIYWPSNYGLHFYPNNDGSYGPAQILGEKGGWKGLHFGGGTGMTLMMNEGEFGFHRQAVGWTARFTSGIGYFDISGNAATATNSSNTNSISNAVGGAYNWTGLNYFVSNQNTTGAGPPLQAYSNNGSGAIMSFHRGGYYAVNMGLDSDNVFRIGGWSAPANRLQLDMSGNLTVATSVNATTYYQPNTSFYFTVNTGSYGPWRIGGQVGGYSGFIVDGDMQLMINGNGVSAPCGFYHASIGWSILTYVNAAQYLYHNGSEKFSTTSDGAYVSGNLYVTGNVYANYSDIRLKKDVEVIKGAISKIKQLRGVTYTWNNEQVNILKERAGIRDIGLIAQEVQSIEPLLTEEYTTRLNTPSKDPKEAENFISEVSEAYMTVKYEKLVALLVEGIKEQQVQIEELKQSINNLTN